MSLDTGSITLMETYAIETELADGVPKSPHQVMRLLKSMINLRNQEMQTNAVNVTISGHDDDVVQATASVISESLRIHGFSNVNVQSLDDHTSQTELPESTTILDLVRQTRPELFHTPINVSYLNTEAAKAREYQEDAISESLVVEPDDQMAMDAERDRTEG